MRIEDLKRWHWLIIGLVLGLGLAYWRGSIGAEEALADGSTLSQREFERLLTETTRSGQHALANIRVFPDSGGVYWVAADAVDSALQERGRRWGRRARRGGDANAPSQILRPVRVRTTTPFIPEIDPPQTNPPTPDYTVIHYLAEMKAKHPEIDYSSGWWHDEPLRSLLWAIGGMLVVGGIWPSVINLLVRAGYAHRTPKDESNYDLSRFGKGQPDAPAPTREQPTDAEIARLKALEAELERNLAAGAPEHDPSAPAPDKPPPAEPNVRVLTGGPVEPVATDKPPEEQDYAGEYYPTVTHVKR